MEVFSLPFTNSPQNFSTLIFTPKTSTRTWYKRNPYRFHSPASKFHRNPSCLLSSCIKNFQISAHFGRPMSRRNSLRKKLIDDLQVRQKDPISVNQTTDFTSSNRDLDNFDNFPETLNYANLKQINANSGVVGDGNVVESGSVKASESKRLGESTLLDKLEDWVHQYQKDAKYWGIGSCPIFTVVQDSDGKVERVSVNEGEILRRSQVKSREFKDLSEVNSKILYAKHLAREMESGKNVIPRSSSVAEFIVSDGQSGLVNIIGDVIVRPDFIPKLSRVGSILFVGMIVFAAVKKLFTYQNKEAQYTEFEKEMMRRKIRSRQQREMFVKSSVEVVQGHYEQPAVSFERPVLDKEELMNTILKAKASKGNSELLDAPSSQAVKSNGTDDNQEVREMTGQVQEFVCRKQWQVDKDEEEKQSETEESLNRMEMVKKHKANDNVFSTLLDDELGKSRGVDPTVVSINKLKGDDTGFLSDIAPPEDGVVQTSITSSVEFSRDKQSMPQDLKDSESKLHSTQTTVTSLSSTPGVKLCTSKNSSIRKKPRVIRSVREAKEFLAKRGGEKQLDQDSEGKSLQESCTVLRLANDKGLNGKTSQRLDMDGKLLETAMQVEISDMRPAMDAYEAPNLKDKEHIPVNKHDHGEDSDEGFAAGDLPKPQTSSNDDINDSSTKIGPSMKMENWLANNFHEVEPVLQRIGDGFRKNYMVAREKARQKLGTSTDITQFGFNEGDTGLEWMKDDSLKEIVFQVRENELAGRDPFHMMDAEDKLAFFRGLEKKVQKENEKLLHVHEWLHTNIENLDYGADGISLYDPPEKIIPRWKGHSLERNPEFLNYFVEQRKAIFSRDAGGPYNLMEDKENNDQRSTESPVGDKIATSSMNCSLEKKNKDPRNSKIVIECSDGSVRSGKKSGKEFWQHTKKWSLGFLESYNAEADPEVKSIIKDMGKDLDRWITEKEIQEAADLMAKLPEKNKKFMEKKLDKLKREMQLFGPQAVVSKYREYAEDKEDDCLWWLDLPHVLCVELYTIENEEQKIGFYSLEMAADLELEPKPCHVITFEDAGDCKNFCHIIQGHMNMLGSGNAFVIPRPPKDAFREAKANGFGVTVLRKGELQLNVDQTLEEVEEQITEIGSKIYHDQIMRERSVDISSIMKGVFGVKGKVTKRRRSKRMLKKPRKK